MQIFKPLPKPNLRGQLPFEALVQKNYRWEIAKTDNSVRAREFASLEIISNPFTVRPGHSPASRSRDRSSHASEPRNLDLATASPSFVDLNPTYALS